MKNIFVAATGQHIGKTTSTLGIVSNLISHGYSVGYCKPVGQQHVNVDNTIADKDAVLFSKIIGFDIKPDIHSPVVLASGVTAQYIDNPENFDFGNRIQHASSELEKEYDIVVYEGTGHPGVGSVVDLSNATVAKMLESGVIMVVEGGIGSTIDRLNMSFSLFKEQNVPIIGVIINKVREDKIEKVRYYLEKKLEHQGIPILGILPYDKTLSFPIMATVCQAVHGNAILNGHKLGNQVEDIVAGSLVEAHEFSVFQNILLVVSYKRLHDAIEKIISIHKQNELEDSPLSGVIVTGDGKHANPYMESDLMHPYFLEHEIPILTTKLDTYGSVVKISKIEVKINIRTPWKAKRAIELIRENINFDYIINRLDKSGVEANG